MINRSQKKRAALILSRLKGLADEIKYADGRSFEFGGAEIRFSKPVPHGMTATRGYVIEVSVKADETFLFTSDVQGPVLERSPTWCSSMAQQPTSTLHICWWN